MKKKYILSICIASYNRKDILISDVQNYLSLGDERFIVTVQDDGSTDGTCDELEKLNDSRLLIRRNTFNLGGSQNAKAALDNHDDCEYVLNLNDKDCIDIKELPSFLDYLKKEKPYYGYVDLSNNKPFHVEFVDKGIDSIKRLSYLCKHPSGYFWKSDLFHEEINKEYYKSLPPKFDYQFDLMYAHCAVQYPGAIVYMPLIINANMRPELAGNISYSYTEENLFFGFPKRLDTYELFLKDIQRLEIDNYTKKEVLDLLTRRTSCLVTISLRFFLQHEGICFHYNMQPRVLSFVEMECNLISTLTIYSKYAQTYSSRIIVLIKKSIIFVRQSLSILKVCFKELLCPYKQKPLVLDN